MPRHSNAVAFQFPRKRKKKELPESEWAFPPDVPLPHPEITSPEYPYYDYETRSWVWNPDSEYTPRKNAWADWEEEE